MVFIGLLLLSFAMLFTPKTAMAIATAEASANRAIMLCFICCFVLIDYWLTPQLFNHYDAEPNVIDPLPLRVIPPSRRA